MDRMPVCGIGDSGSIPGESTKAGPESETFWAFAVVALTRNRTELRRSPQALAEDRKEWGSSE